MGAANGEVCPSGEYVVGFDANGDISCAPLVAASSAPAGGCPSSTYTFSTTSVKTGAVFPVWTWPGATLTQSDPNNPGCSVTVTVPFGPISDFGGTQGTNGWSVLFTTGYSTTVTEVSEPNCNSLSAASITGNPANFPTCSDDVADVPSSSDTYTVIAS